MPISKPLAVGMLAAVPVLAPPCMACALMNPDALLLKKAMASEIAFRLAIKVEQVALDDITTPVLQRPFALGPDCSGLAGFHHSAGFRVAVAMQQHAFAIMRKPQTAVGAGARYRARYHAGLYSSRPGAGVLPNFWHVPKAKPTPDADYSSYCAGRNIRPNAGSRRPSRPCPRPSAGRTTRTSHRSARGHKRSRPNVGPPSAQRLPSPWHKAFAAMRAWPWCWAMTAPAPWR